MNALSSCDSFSILLTFDVEMSRQHHHLASEHFQSFCVRFPELTSGHCTTLHLNQRAFVTNCLSIHNKHIES